MPPAVGVFGMLALEAIATVLIVTWARRERWRDTHYLAIASGTVLTYAWVGLGAFLSGRTHLGAPTSALDDIGQVIEVLAVLGLIALARRRSGLLPCRRRSHSQSTRSDHVNRTR
jgi:hypothetical protein